MILTHFYETDPNSFFTIGSRAMITEIRIQGCAKEPCTLKKGKRLMFEIDFSFQKPQSTNEIGLLAFAGFWNIAGTGI